MTTLAGRNMSKSGTQLLPQPRAQPVSVGVAPGPTGSSRRVAPHPCVPLGERRPPLKVGAKSLLDITRRRITSTARAVIDVGGLDAIESIEAQSIVDTPVQQAAAAPLHLPPLGSSPPAATVPAPPARPRRAAVPAPPALPRLTRLPPRERLPPLAFVPPRQAPAFWSPIAPRLAPTMPSSLPLPALPAIDARGARPTRKAVLDGLLGLALDAHARDAEGVDASAQPRRAPWGALLIIVLLLAALLISAAFAPIEVPVEAAGALRAPNGLRSVESALPGVVRELLVGPGDRVEAGQVMVQLEDAKLRSSLVAREQRLDAFRREMEEASRDDAAALDRAMRASRRQRDALRARHGIQQTILRKRRARLSDVQALVASGAANADDALLVDEALQATTEQVAMLESRVTDVELAQADRLREWQARELERRATLSERSAAVEEARVLLASATIRSPSSGRVESVLASVGHVVDSGEVLAQVAPTDAPRSIVAFLAPSQAALVSVGSEAQVRVESLSDSKLGVARARVTRLSAESDGSEESASTLGAGASSEGVSGAVADRASGEGRSGSRVRMELELLDDAAEEKVIPHLRSGERMLVRLHGRERRVLSVAFELVSRWLEP
jgi:adhesin transport system membrane fusion protein